MTYSLPFGLKQKPINKYFKWGVIKFNVREGKLYYTVKRITKESNSVLFKGEVKSLEDLRDLLEVQSLNEIQTIEEVVN